MHIVLVGVNHRSAPIAIRERLAFSRERLPEALRRLREEAGLAETAILSTCNRVEIYGSVDARPEEAVGRVHQFLSRHAALELSELHRRLYSHLEPTSVEHLFSVTSGLDSMVLGEGEIVHQVKHGVGGLGIKFRGVGPP